MGVGFVLYTEQTYRIVVKTVDFIGILRIDSFNGNIDIRLTGEQPNVANVDIGDRWQVLSIGGYFQRIRASCLHLGEVDAPPAISIGLSSVLLFIPADGHLLVSISLSPDRDGFVAL